MLAVGCVSDIPAFQSIHKLSWRLETFSHLTGLLSDHAQSFLEKPTLVFRRWRGRHVAESAILSCEKRGYIAEKVNHSKQNESSCDQR